MSQPTLDDAHRVIEAPQHEPASIARALFETIDAGDVAGAGAMLEDSFRLHYQGVPDPISKPDFLDALRSYNVAFSDMRHDVQQVWLGGDHVTVRLMLHATHVGTHEGVPATGRRIDVGAIHVFRVANGNVAEWWAAEDDLGLLRQLGMIIEPPPPGA